MISSENTNNDIINQIRTSVGNNNEFTIREFIIGTTFHIDATVLYMNGLVQKDIIDRNILRPLMIYAKEDLRNIPDLENYLYKKYITASAVKVSLDINEVISSIKRGKTIIWLNGSPKFIIVDSTGGTYRDITDSQYETTPIGPRDSFVENLETNVSMLKRRVKDKSLKTELFCLGRRSQTDVILMYIDDIVDKNILNELREKISAVDIDSVLGSSILSQCIDKYPFGIFPQAFSSERPDRIQASLMEGKIALLVQETPFVVTFPTLFIEFFQTVEDYYYHPIVASFTRFLRLFAALIVICLPALYLSIIQFNAELIPVEFVKNIIKARKGIVLTPFMSIISMNLIVEFLREGGLRLPSKIGQTLSVVGGIIIGNAALQAKVVSSLTLLVVGITTIATFLIPNYEMSLSIRLLSYPTLILSNWLGLLGVAIAIFIILGYLASLENYGVPYLSFRKSDIKDSLIRAPIEMLKKRPETIPNTNETRQTDFKSKFIRRKNGEEN